MRKFLATSRVKLLTKVREVFLYEGRVVLFEALAYSFLLLNIIIIIHNSPLKKKCDHTYFARGINV